ncbi:MULTISPECIES: hypothetical protein [Fischerella]|nr:MULTISPECIES: hypothetical protein [Fischerella]MBD2434445.1 hypothetical protein [Fischerella sp. FACHB-380]
MQKTLLPGALTPRSSAFQIYQRIGGKIIEKVRLCRLDSQAIANNHTSFK